MKRLELSTFCMGNGAKRVQVGPRAVLLSQIGWVEVRLDQSESGCFGRKLGRNFVSQQTTELEVPRFRVGRKRELGLADVTRTESAALELDRGSRYSPPATARSPVKRFTPRPG